MTTTSPLTTSADSLSPSLTSSSFDLLSSTLSRSSSADDAASICSDDEIVWSLSEISSSRPATATDEDYVVVSNDNTSTALVQSPVGNPTCASTAPHELPEDELAAGIASLSLGEIATCGVSHAHTPKGKKKKPRKKKVPQTVPGAAPQQKPSASKVRTATAPSSKRKAKKKAKSTGGLGTRPVVDDMSDRTSDFGEGFAGPIYEAAVNYITSFLTDPERREGASRLSLLQAFIIELGLCSDPVLPASIKAAKLLLKSRAFVNIRDYIAVRDQGLPALQRIMHPSRSALIRDIKKNGSHASASWVKKHGLQVFLVTCYH